ncbi:ead/Ea22-like family protein [Pseudomonas sp. CCI3.2]|uniref:ead/Ea22-like family protein n=1 Tax=unclassified Pseudomonas TaxID=196821 RepID=UPI002B233A87|nr:MULTISPECIES: ead/Ea22-like family protein [unclassified Pseudomonas]MEB0078033.1 ead/Ea22-like family protein [Pseudomonas sp. MH10out]MEB0104040.1 ead/Ea22-like family protein [Pseudomonas sp. CCI3.2]MEB0133543.1 ead/Ea22-like family protein [Pseudomonas sp. CCI2.4]
MSDHAKLKELADAATKGQWTCTSRPYGPFWQISSDHTVDGKDLQGASRQAIASYHAASKKNQPAYAAMFEANAKFAAAANPAVVLGLIAELTQLKAECEGLRRKVRIQQRLNESAESIRKDAGGQS